MTQPFPIAACSERAASKIFRAATDSDVRCPFRCLSYSAGQAIRSFWKSTSRRHRGQALKLPGVETVLVRVPMTMVTRDQDNFYMRLNDVVMEHNIEIDLVTLADENVQSIYRYLSGREHH